MKEAILYLTDFSNQWFGEYSMDNFNQQIHSKENRLKENLDFWN